MELVPGRKAMLLREHLAMVEPAPQVYAPLPYRNGNGGQQIMLIVR